MSGKTVPSASELLKDDPKNWNRWGAEDEVGCLNFLTSDEVLRGVRAVRQGKTFTLQVVIGHPQGDPIGPGRKVAQRVNVMDKGYYLAGKGPVAPGGLEFADDMMVLYLQGSTQYDALGHVWYDDALYNGYDAKTTIGGMSRASVLPIAERGIVGRGVLIDIARHRGKPVLDAGETFTHDDVLAAAAAQKTTIEKHDILILRTGWIGTFHERERERERERCARARFVEPGLTYSPELVAWFHEMEIPNLVTDTIGNEVTTDPESGVVLPLHNALMRNLGVTFTEIAELDPLASDCAADGQYTFLYAAAPLKIRGGSGAPVNPIVVK